MSAYDLHIQPLHPETVREIDAWAGERGLDAADRARAHRLFAILATMVRLNVARSDEAEAVHA